VLVRDNLLVAGGLELAGFEVDLLVAAGGTPPA